MYAGTVVDVPAGEWLGRRLGYQQEGSLIQDGESELQDQFVLRAPFGVFEAKSLQCSP